MLLDHLGVCRLLLVQHQQKLVHHGRVGQQQQPFGRHRTGTRKRKGKLPLVFNEGRAGGVAVHLDHSVVGTLGQQELLAFLAVGGRVFFLHHHEAKLAKLGALALDAKGAVADAG